MRIWGPYSLRYVVWLLSLYALQDCFTRKDASKIKEYNYKSASGPPVKKLLISFRTLISRLTDPARITGFYTLILAVWDMVVIKNITILLELRTVDKLDTRDIESTHIIIYLSTIFLSNLESLWKQKLNDKSNYKTTKWTGHLFGTTFLIHTASIVVRNFSENIYRT